MIGLHVAPWIAGTHSVAYFGPVVAYVEDSDYESGMMRMFDVLEQETERRGGNNVVGMDISIDPFAVPPRFTAQGTASLLERVG